MGGVWRLELGAVEDVVVTVAEMRLQLRACFVRLEPHKVSTLLLQQLQATINDRLPMRLVKRQDP
eukprot:CAMPEP_0173114642 /NCGR_PEP_ID=MMETSP1102-20130122/47808_1 /TAXON_ID=49646 /ORGANISM="Geminigera sp., Strain Caron Lab Isolate" /LENGTH=64 /DNA_ID=CAMNT_0014017089 /DNA_START=33 /DNA_END=224 /DNA_ORIENTATION=+